LAGAATGAAEDVDFGGRSGANGEACAVVEHQVERLHVVGDFATQQAMNAATVVADHAAQGAAGVGCGVGRIGQMEALGGLAEPVEDDAGLHAGQLGIRVDRLQLIHITGVIEDDGDVGALAGEAGSGSAGQNGGSGGAAGGQGGFDIGCVLRQYDADRKLAIVRGVGGVEGARTEIEADLAAKGFLEQRLQLAVG